MISIIIPVYNEEKTIKECLISLLKQKGVEYEIIVVDDGSTDSTLSILATFKSASSKIRIYEQNHKGPAVARNYGAKKSGGSILAFVDSDMTFDPNFIYELTLPIVAGEQKGTFTKNEYVSNWGNVWARCWNYNQNIKTDKRIPDNYPDKSPVFRAILKSEFTKVNGFDPIGYTDDWTLSRKLGFKSHFSSGATCFHKNPDSLKEVLNHSQWIGKNEFINKSYKRLLNIIRYSLPVSIIIGLVKSIIYLEPRFIIFKCVYDYGVLQGILSKFSSKKVY